MPHDMLAVRSHDGLGYRAKIGLLIPATNTICQPECEAMRPIGVTNHVARMTPIPRGEAGDMEAYRRSLRHDTSRIKEAISSVAQCKPDMIVLGHSIDTFRDGPPGAAEMKADLELHSGGIPVVLPSHALLAALGALGIMPGTGRTIALMSPYWPPADEQVLDFFTRSGYRVSRILGLKRPSAIAIAETPMPEVIEALRTLAADKPDIIIEPGSNLPVAALSAQAALWLDLPVVSCNVATYWHALRLLGITDKMKGFGPLLETH